MTYGPIDAPVAQWTVSQPSLALLPADLTTLRSHLTGGAFIVQQIGTYAQSDALLLAHLT